MTAQDPFLYGDLTPDDQITFIKAFQIGLAAYGQSSCWCMKDRILNRAGFEGFTTSKKQRLTYRGQDARPLLLAVSQRFSSPEKPIIVRRAICNSKYCLNPAHYYWGTRVDVAAENAERKKTGINSELINTLRKEKEEGTSSLKLSKKYRMPYHTVRRICNYESYETIASKGKKDTLKIIWDNVLSTYIKLMKMYPDSENKYNLNCDQAQVAECPWHQKSTTKHKGNFGLMKECLDCMDEIKRGRCSIDVRNFDFRWYWQIKRFWEQVDIGEQDECWPWLGATKKEGKESVANFPSPFHVGVSQAATRVAFWLSRGYTGKYRVFTKRTCEPFCCNPLHSTIRELKCQPSPKKIEVIKTNHDNIIDFYKKKKNNIKKKSSSTK